MRRLLLAAALFLPAPLVAQYPEPGSYKMIARPAGQDQEIPLIFRISRVGDSTAIVLAQGEDNVVPLKEQGLIAGGFYFAFGALRCPFVTVDDHWEAVCADLNNEPQFVLTFPRQPEPPAKP